MATSKGLGGAFSTLEPLPRAQEPLRGVQELPPRTWEMPPRPSNHLEHPGATSQGLRDATKIQKPLATTWEPLLWT